MERHKKRKSTTHVRVFEPDRQRLMSIKESTGFRSLARVVHGLLKEQAKNLATVETVMRGRTPVVLRGKPYSGKTFFVITKLLPSLDGYPVLVIDSWNDYKKLKKIGYSIYSLNFREFHGHMRFIPNAQSRVAITEVESIFAHLDMKRSEMSRWVIIVEEAHTFQNVPSFTKFLYGSRHIVRKMVVVTPKTDAFLGLETVTILSPKERDASLSD